MDAEQQHHHYPQQPSSEAQLLDAMETELRLAHKMVQELKNAPRASAPVHKRQKPCCFCANNNILQKGADPDFSQQQYLVLNASDMVSPDPFCTPPALLRISARSSHLSTPRRTSRTASHVSQKLFEETQGNQDGLMLAVDKFLSAGDFLPPS
ncbi:hypothetical protein L7F22_007316 [Adiantum nelumboides]|nr:hypothetical protein [Adiantum nelumboides]